MPDFEVREVDVDDEAAAARVVGGRPRRRDRRPAVRPLRRRGSCARVAYPDRHPDWRLRRSSRSTTVTASSAPAMVNMPLADNLSNAYARGLRAGPASAGAASAPRCSPAVEDALRLTRGGPCWSPSRVAPPERRRAPASRSRRRAGYAAGQPRGRQGPRPGANAPTDWAATRRAGRRTGSGTTAIVEWGGTTPERARRATVCDALNALHRDDPDGRPRDGGPRLHARAAAPQRARAASTSAPLAWSAAALAAGRHAGRLHATSSSTSARRDPGPGSASPWCCPSTAVTPSAWR